jgi:hypothetical protein
MKVAVTGVDVKLGAELKGAHQHRTKEAGDDYFA